jgi:hypothetical protein
VAERTKKDQSMKKLLTVAFIFLSGCSILQVSHFDGNEYGLASAVRTEASLQKCTPENVQSLYETALNLKNYSEHLPNNKNSFEMSSGLFTLVDELHQKQTINETYCKLKLKSIEESAERIQKTLGGQAR